jgi:hypothetical protein
MSEAHEIMDEIDVMLARMAWVSEQRRELDARRGARREGVVMPLRSTSSEGRR